MMKTHNNEKGSDRRLPTLRRRLIVYLAIPAAIILAAIWLTETFFLGTLHRAVKEGEMRKVAAQIAAADAGSLDGAVERLGMKYNLCVSVYDMNKGGRETASWHSTVNPFCFIHGFVSDSLARFDVDVGRAVQVDPLAQKVVCSDFCFFGKGCGKVGRVPHQLGAQITGQAA